MTQTDTDTKTNRYPCPVCLWKTFRHKPYSGDICPACGFELGFDDGVHGITHEQLRAKWLSKGGKWWSGCRAEYIPEFIEGRLGSYD